MTHLSRRRFLTITAAAASLPNCLRAAPRAEWRGVALGAAASMRFEGLSDEAAAPIFSEVEAEIARLEAVFSLYHPTSELTQLNRDGHLLAPSADLLEVLSLAAALHKASGGRFDPTIQPLWHALATGSPKDIVDGAQAMVGFKNVKFEASGIFFEKRADGPIKPGITLNGIAQGAITDRVCDLLRARGLQNVLIDLGEIYAIGHRGNGVPWRVGIANPENDLVHRIALSDRAVATSATHGTILDRQSNLGHIVNPLGAQAPLGRVVSVTANTAAVADGLSTALCLMPPGQVSSLIKGFGDARVEIDVSA